MQSLNGSLHSAQSSPRLDCLWLLRLRLLLRLQWTSGSRSVRWVHASDLRQRTGARWGTDLHGWLRFRARKLLSCKALLNLVHHCGHFTSSCRLDHLRILPQIDAGPRSRPSLLPPAGRPVIARTCPPSEPGILSGCLERSW